MMKVKALGIHGAIFNWTEDWLVDREQRVVLLGNNQTLSVLCMEYFQFIFKVQC
jgi:hypothetical protein